MSWSGGEELLWKVWFVTRPYIPESERSKILGYIIDKFRDQDMDDGYLYESLSEYSELGPVLHQLDPEMFDENGNCLEEL